MKLVLATGNLNKIREYRQMMKRFPVVDIISLRDFPDYNAPEETGSTFEENALIKAEDAARTLNEWVIADDSGLVVPIIDGAPGVFSARYAGTGCSDADNRHKLLKAMEKCVGMQRAAYFECCITLVGPEKQKRVVSARCEGTILEKPRGSNGFGYDALFVKNDYDKTFAELDEQTKNLISHRRKAFDKMALILEGIFTEEDLVGHRS